MLLRPHNQVRYVDHVVERGRGLFELACQRDLEGIVGKWSQGTYWTSGGQTSWVKIKNPNYSQVEGRAELFDQRGAREQRVRRRPLHLALG